MIKRKFGFLEPRCDEVSEETRHLHDRGYVVLPGVYSVPEVERLAADVCRVFEQDPRDARPSTLKSPRDDMFRYEMLNRSAACQEALANPRVLATIEPLLGEDCHVIANTAWRNPAAQESPHGSVLWHIDAGPHVPRPAGTCWPPEIPYPVFAIASHCLLQDSRIEDGPTAVIPGSHRSGRHPPFESVGDPELRCDGEGAVPLLGKAGDVLLFVSDVWHRRMETQPGSRGRFFVQVHYARRDIAQRLRVTDDANQLSAEARGRAHSKRERSLVGLHEPSFYDG